MSTKIFIYASVTSVSSEKLEIMGLLVIAIWNMGIYGLEQVLSAQFMTVEMGSP